MAAQSATIEAGHVHLPKSNDWLGFLHELLAFPYGQHDGQVDSVSQFLNGAARHRFFRAFIDRPLLPPAEVHGGWEEEQISCRCRAGIAGKAALLVSPGKGQRAHERRDGEVRRRGTVQESRDDPGREEGQRCQ